MPKQRQFVPRRSVRLAKAMLRHRRRTCGHDGPNATIGAMAVTGTTDAVVAAHRTVSRPSSLARTTSSVMVAIDRQPIANGTLT